MSCVGWTRAVASAGLVQRRRLEAWSVVIWTRALARFEVGPQACNAEEVFLIENTMVA